jgi:hypothetical protein
MVGLAVALWNTHDIGYSFMAGSLFSMIAGLASGILGWAARFSKRKGIHPGLGILLVIVFNGVGVLILLLLPNNKTE